MRCVSAQHTDAAVKRQSGGKWSAPTRPMRSGSEALSLAASPLRASTAAAAGVTSTESMESGSDDRADSGRAVSDAAMGGAEEGEVREGAVVARPPVSCENLPRITPRSCSPSNAQTSSLGRTKGWSRLM